MLAWVWQVRAGGVPAGDTAGATPVPHPACAHHLLRHLLGHVPAQLEQELNGLVVPRTPPTPHILHAQPELEVGLLAVILLSQLHVHATLLTEEGVGQQVLDGEP